MKVYKTTNYSLFKTIKGNREIDSAHLKKLIASISKRNLLSEHPIVVSNTYKVIDGQHRLESAKALEVPIYYTVVDKGGLEEVLMLNNAQKNWTVKDFLDSHIARGNANYIILKDFVTQYSLPVSVGVSILSKNSGHRAMALFRDGGFEVVREKEAYEIGQMLVEYRRYADSGCYRSKDFITAIIYMHDHAPVPHFQMIQKLIKTGRMIEKQMSVKEYLRSFEEIYNWKKREFIRFFGEV